MTIQGFTRKQALEHAAEEAREHQRCHGVRPLALDAHADLWLKWANLLEQEVPLGAKGQQVYVRTSLRRQHRLVRRAAARHPPRIEFYHGAGESSTNRELDLYTDEALSEEIEKKAVREQEMTLGEMEYAWGLVMAVLKTQDQIRALRLRLDGEQHETIALALGARPATVRKWFSRDMRLAFERAGHGEVWRRLQSMMGAS